MDRLPNYDDIVNAARQLEGEAVVTPLVESGAVNAQFGGRLLLKAEMLQRGGSFKFRGAYNYLSRLNANDKRRGVITFSSGNLAQGIALAARALRIPATIVMPMDAPAIKIANTRRSGAEVVLYDRRHETREKLTPRLAAERNLIYDDPHEQRDMLTGYGTAGLEIAAQSASANAPIDVLIVPCSGGSLVAGCALGLEQKYPGAAVYGVEPEGFDDTARSFAANSLLSNDMTNRTICDGLLAVKPGKLPFMVNRRLLAGILTVSDAEVMRAMALAFHEFKLVVEPSGAVALAALLAGKIDCVGKTVAIVCSGGSVDDAMFATALASGRDKPRVDV
jgi:threonine dehydratase